MDINKNLINKLKERYNVYYNHLNEAWVRNEGKWVRNDFDLGVVTELITGENILTIGKSYVKYKEYSVAGEICICGCPFCTKLYRLYHIKTNECFLVGSKCIKKAGHPNFINNLKCGKTNGFCRECKFPLIRQGERKNSKKEFHNICMDCNKPVDIYLNISFDDKDKYKKYGTKWNPNVKKWYWSGCKDKLPPELIPLKRI